VKRYAKRVDLDHLAPHDLRRMIQLATHHSGLSEEPDDVEKFTTGPSQPVGADPDRGSPEIEI
jgi:hypothetical protein